MPFGFFVLGVFTWIVVTLLAEFCFKLYEVYDCGWFCVFVIGAAITCAVYVCLWLCFVLIIGCYGDV